MKVLPSSLQLLDNTINCCHSLTVICYFQLEVL